MKAGAGERPVPFRKIKVLVANGSLAYAEHPVAVGHYEDDIISGAESYLNRCLGDRLKVRYELGLYPGPLETAAVFLNPDRGARPVGAIVVGLGPLGELSPLSLAKTVTTAALAHALAVAEDPSPASATTPRTASISTLLIGAGRCGVSVQESIRATLQGVRRASLMLASRGHDAQVVFDTVEFLELWEDRAILAARALHQLHADPELQSTFDFSQERIRQAPGGKTRVTFDEDPYDWQRIKIVGEPDGSLRFSLLTDRARTEVSVHGTQRALVDRMIERAVFNTGRDEGVAKTLYELLLPDRLKDQANRRQNLVLLLNEDSARYPWELLEDRASESQKPLAVEMGVIRQLETGVFRERAVTTARKTALVIGEPKSSFPPLPQAQEEAERVRGALLSRGYKVEIRNGSTALEVVEALYAQPYRILHLAGHGVYQHKVVGKDVTFTGMVIGDDVFLTPAEIEQMRRIPELVFINCCYLGRTESREGNYHRLAANLAAQFIRIGVRAVVAAGWMVDDQPAKVFAVRFYQEILAGVPFGQAVLQARREAYEKYPSLNTWGAFQCYGDPDFMLEEASRRSEPVHRSSGSPNVACMHMPSEAIAELRNLAGEAATASPREAENLRSRLAEFVGQLSDDWLERADVNAALGRAYRELEMFSEAAARYQAALDAETHDSPLSSLEQMADLQSRLALQAARERSRGGEANGSTPEAAESLQQIDSAINLLRKVCEIGKSRARLRLLGAAHRRKARITTGDERRAALEAMADCYRQAADQRHDSGAADPESLLNWLMAEIILRRHAPDGEAQSMKELLERLDQAEQAAREGVSRDPDLGIAPVQCAVLRHVARADLTSHVDAIVTALETTRSRATCLRERRMALEHLEFLLEMIQGGAGADAEGQELAGALQTILERSTSLKG
jgi:tetratricopeptide (TPR) repeat protein